MDATRRRDGLAVILKRVVLRKPHNELRVCQIFADPHTASLPQNYCLRLLDIVDIPNNPRECLIVLPLLLPFHIRPFETVGEAIEFFQQMFSVRSSALP